MRGELNGSANRPSRGSSQRATVFPWYYCFAALDCLIDADDVIVRSAPLRSILES
jgi:hypothetical protein